MKKKLQITTVLAVVLGMVSAQAAEITWNGSIDNDAGNAANWDGGVLPGVGDQMHVTIGGSGPVITSDMQVTRAGMGGMQAYFNVPTATAPTTLTLQSGTFTSDEWFLLGVDDNTTNTFNMSGGTLSVGTDLFIGAHLCGSGTYNMSGGTATANNFAVGWSLGGADTGDAQFGQFNLTGGDITVNVFGIYGNGQVDITDGQLNINADVVDGVNTMIANGDITAFGGIGTVIVSYDGGQTHVSAIPEPATLGLVALMGGGLLWIRKKNRI